MNAHKLLSYALQPRRPQTLHNTIQPFPKPSTIPTRSMATSPPSSTDPEATSPNAADSQPNRTSKTPLPLPAPHNTDTTQIDMTTGGSTVKLDHMGPLVVNKDGTLSRIANWDTMAEIERQNTLRILGKRNMLRREGLEKAQAEKEKERESGEK